MQKAIKHALALLDTVLFPAMLVSSPAAASGSCEFIEVDILFNIYSRAVCIRPEGGRHCVKAVFFDVDSCFHGLLGRGRGGSPAARHLLRDPSPQFEQPVSNLLRQTREELSISHVKRDEGDLDEFMASTKVDLAQGPRLIKLKAWVAEIHVSARSTDPERCIGTVRITTVAESSMSEAFLRLGEDENGHLINRDGLVQPAQVCETMCKLAQSGIGLLGRLITMQDLVDAAQSCIVELLFARFDIGGVTCVPGDVKSF